MVKKQMNPYGMRIPEDLKKDLEKSAKKGERSLNSEMVARLRESLEDEQHFQNVGKDDPLYTLWQSARAITTLLNSIVTSIIHQRVKAGEAFLVQEEKSDYTAKNEDVAKNLEVLVKSNLFTRDEYHLVESFRELPKDKKAALLQLFGMESGPTENTSKKAKNI